MMRYQREDGQWMDLTSLDSGEVELEQFSADGSLLNVGTVACRDEANKIVAAWLEDADTETTTVTIGEVEYTLHRGWVEAWHDWKGYVGGFPLDAAPLEVFEALNATRR